ncbi:MAG: hypothetical protein GC185_07705 [Alphaproteobacteria bacterium]|nr:hypothetical protein [Alphaproteobacteria bacterium]
MSDASRFSPPRLPGPDKPYALPLNLALVEALEEAGGGLMQLAERLLRKELPVSDMLRVLRAAYRFSGCTLEDGALETFILQNAPPLLLAEILLCVLTPLQAAGAVKDLPPGE